MKRKSPALIFLIRFGWIVRNVNNILNRLIPAERDLSRRDTAGNRPPRRLYRRFRVWPTQRDLHTLFDPNWYLAQNKDVAGSGIDPRRHYVKHGAAEGRAPHPLFDPAHVASQLPRGSVGNESILTYFIANGTKLRLDPNPLFDTAWYLAKYPDVAAAGVNPLLHYILTGAAEGRDPHPRFETNWYMSQYPEVASSGANPLAHYLTEGREKNFRSTSVNELLHECPVTAIGYEIYKRPNSLAGSDVCLFLTFTPHGDVAPHVLYYLRGLRSCGLKIVVIVVTNGLDRDLPDDIKSMDGVFVRANHGWDFAGWAAVLTVIPAVWKARSLIFANDSVFGPIEQRRLATCVDRIRSSKKDFVALTDSWQTRHHAQSYFFAFTGRGLAKKAVVEFWASVRSVRDKERVINSYELSMLETFRSADVSTEILFPTNHRKEINPTLVSWRELLDRGFPFIKVQLLRDHLPFTDPNGWQSYLSDNVILGEMIEGSLTESARREKDDIFRPRPGMRRSFLPSTSIRKMNGSVASLRLGDGTDRAIEVPFRYSKDLALTPPGARVAVIAHIFYPELSRSLRTAIENIPVRADIYITTDSEEKRTAIKAEFARYFNGLVEIRVTPAIGRDIAPMLLSCRDVFDRYDIFLRIHSKKSSYDPDLADWREYMLQCLAGSPEIVVSILSLLTDTDVGIVFPQHFPHVRPILDFGQNFEKMKGILARAGISLARNLVLEFPSGSFYWGRSAAIKPLLDIGLQWSNFLEKEDQIDGTMAHAIERSILFFAESNGFRWAKVGRQGQYASADELVPSLRREDLSNDVTRVHRWLIDQPVNFPRKGAYRVRSISVRRDAETRARLNLLLASLEDVTEEAVNAKSFFEYLSQSAWGEFDLRIIVTDQPVSLNAMRDLPDFTLVNPAVVPDAFPCTVLDASDAFCGQMSLRVNDFVVAAGWKAAATGFDLAKHQHRFYGVENPIIYLIQDDEPGGYGASSDRELARLTFREGEKTIGVVYSDELALFVRQCHQLPDLQTLPFSLDPELRRRLTLMARERLILVWASARDPRDCIAAVLEGLIVWQNRNPTAATQWRIVLLGGDHDLETSSMPANLEFAGEISLAEYADILSRATVGVSLKVSPRPSVKALEMAAAGLRTITSGFDDFDRSHRNARIASVEAATGPLLAEALEKTIAAAEAEIGRIVDFAEIRRIETQIPDFDAQRLLERLQSLCAHNARITGNTAIAER